MPCPLLWPIDWMFIAVATRFFSMRGFQHIEVPWVVPPHITAATIPPHIEARRTQDGDLIGSGEQGILSLAAEGRLGPGLYQTTTPCFRDDGEDDLHGKHFMKVELMHLDIDPTVEPLLNAARTLFEMYFPVRVIDMGGGQRGLVDAQTGTELGSYGVREALGVRWAYGTGLAEPRFSFVREHLRR